MQKCREIIDFTALSGGLEGIRTLDLSDANRTLSQLSYEPVWHYFVVFRARLADRLLSHLSYKPILRYFVVFRACLADVLLSQTELWAHISARIQNIFEPICGQAEAESP